MCESLALTAAYEIVWSPNIAFNILNVMNTNPLQIRTSKVNVVIYLYKAIYERKKNYIVILSTVTHM